MAGTSKKVAHTYDHLAGKLDAFSNYWVDVATRAGGYVIHTGGRSLELVDKQPPTSVGGLLFCMPHNDKLDRYCDVIEERLFNLRHCRNIEGVARDLPLLDPPIDPELLIRATAAGLDLNSVVAGLYAAPPHYHYGMLAARATELAAETKSTRFSHALGNGEARRRTTLAIKINQRNCHWCSRLANLRNYKSRKQKRTLLRYAYRAGLPKHAIANTNAY